MRREVPSRPRDRIPGPVDSGIEAPIVQGNLELWLEPQDFDETASPAWPDRSGNNRNGSDEGSVVASGGYVSFNGGADNVIFSDDPVWDTPGDFTISWWIKTSQIGDKVVVGHGNVENEASGWFLKFFNGVFFFITQGIVGEWNSGISFNDGNWHQLVLRRQANILTLFKDNVNVNSIALASDPVANADSFRIGHGGSNTLLTYVGLSGQFLLYSRALSDPEIESNYNSTAAQYP